MKEVIKSILGVFLNIFYKIELVNIHNVPEQGAALLCANHIQNMDLLVMSYKLKRLVRYMAKEELFKVPGFAQLLKWLGAFPIKRGKGDVGAIKTAINLLEEGHIVGIFPEGTRMKGKEKNAVAAKRGAIMIAIHAGVPIIPVGIKATYKPFSKVTIVYGEPFYLNVERDKKYTSAEMKEIANNLMDKVYSLVENK